MWRPGQARQRGVCNPTGTGVLCHSQGKGLTWGPLTPGAPFCWHTSGSFSLMSVPRDAICGKSLFRALTAEMAKPAIRFAWNSHLMSILKTVTGSHILGIRGGHPSRPHLGRHRIAQNLRTRKTLKTLLPLATSFNILYFYKKCILSGKIQRQFRESPSSALPQLPTAWVGAGSPDSTSALHLLLPSLGPKQVLLPSRLAPPGGSRQQARSGPCKLRAASDPAS